MNEIFIIHIKRDHLCMTYVCQCFDLSKAQQIRILQSQHNAQFCGARLLIKGRKRVQYNKFGP